ncbi:NYN domain-containing protein [Agilicoccus flavus]|uniref:NYN domain-containing protein n=1 Tax=Agilicoccus flavus TaxID=2775968 RepID=UPI001CF6119E|nr:NYN domain-containing protein [Agilicoccus flavus]
MLRTTFVLDYQNVHLTARDVFCPSQDAHHALIHPIRFAQAALRARNAGQRPGFEPATLGRVLTYRGLSHVDHDSEQNARCQAQAQEWQRAGAHVVLRDLKYDLQRDTSGSPVRTVNGKTIPIGRGREKGIDVLCALACVREARADDVELVVLASRDSDLVPVLDEVFDMRGSDPSVAKIETVTWHLRVPGGRPRGGGSLRPGAPRRIWNTNLDRTVFTASRDLKAYT